MIRILTMMRIMIMMMTKIDSNSNDDDEIDEQIINDNYNDNK